MAPAATPTTGRPDACASRIDTPNVSSAIADTLQQKGVVKSAQAFTDACGDSKCSGIQPGVYKMRLQMSGAAAVALILSKAAQDAGYLINNVQPDTIRLAPPLIVDHDQVGGFLSALPSALDSGSA